jgi:hypothetical protein
MYYMDVIVAARLEKFPEAVSWNTMKVREMYGTEVEVDISRRGFDAIYVSAAPDNAQFSSADPFPLLQSIMSKRVSV